MDEKLEHFWGSLKNQFFFFFWGGGSQKNQYRRLAFALIS